MAFVSSMSLRRARESLIDTSCSGSSPSTPVWGITESASPINGINQHYPPTRATRYQPFMDVEVRGHLNHSKPCCQEKPRPRVNQTCVSSRVESIFLSFSQARLSLKRLLGAPHVPSPCLASSSGAKCLPTIVTMYQFVWWHIEAHKSGYDIRWRP
jgi:hypothetical protein